MRRVALCALAVFAVQLGLGIGTQALGISAAWSPAARAAVGLVELAALIICVTTAVWVMGVRGTKRLLLATLVTLVAVAVTVAVVGAVYVRFLLTTARSGGQGLAAAQRLGASPYLSAFATSIAVVGFAVLAARLVSRKNCSGGESSASG